MTLISCATPRGGLGLAAVKNTLWQQRLKSAGLSQRQLAELLGVSENTVSRQMKGDWGMPGYVLAVVIAWEDMTNDARGGWVTRLRRERKPKGQP